MESRGANSRLDVGSASPDTNPGLGNAADRLTASQIL